MSKILSKVATPNLDKLASVRAESQKIGEFLAWLDEQGVVLARYGEDEDEADDGNVLLSDHRGITAWLAKYFDIDEAACEQERRVLLQNLAQLNQD